MNDTLRTIAQRRSFRQFKKEQIRDDELQAILDAGLQAPSGHNDQSWYLTVIQNRERNDQISDGSKQEMLKLPVDWMVQIGKNENFHIFYHAPTVILVAAREDAISPIADACAAIENMLIAAESLGMGSCWIDFARLYFTSPERYREVGIPEGYKVHYSVALGYKPDGLQPNPRQMKRDHYFHIIK